MLLGAALWITTPANAGNPVSQPLIYTKADFHGGSHTWDIKQDSRGVMYFANSSGLLTFNGNFWRSYSLPNGTLLRSIHIDANDRVYAGGQGEVGYFEPDSSGVLRFTSLKGKIPRRYAHFADVWNIAGKGESVFFRTERYIFQLTDQAIEVHLPANGWQFLGEAGGRVFAQDKSNGLLEFLAGRWQPVTNSQMLLGSYIVSDLVPLKNRGLLVTTLDNQYFPIRDRTMQPPAQKHREPLYTPSFSKLNDSLIVAATSTRGCVILDKQLHIIQQIASGDGLQGNNASSVFVDRNADIWVGIDNGICFISYNSPVKYLRPNKVNDVEGFSSLVFNNSLYISTSNGLYMAPVTAQASGLLNIAEDFTLVKNSDNGEARKIEEINQQLMLAHNNGIYQVKGREAVPVSLGTGTWTLLPTTSGFLAPSILAGTYNGLELLRYSGGSFRSEGKMSGLPDSYRFLQRDNQQNIWASHPYRGIYRMTLAADNKSYSSRLYTSKDGLPADINNYVFRIRNRIVFATVRGIYEFNPGQDRFSRSAYFDRLFGQAEIRYMAEDPEGNIWFTNRDKIGVVDFSKPGDGRDFSITYFPELTDTFLRGLENIYPYNRRNVFIGSERGVIHLDYARYIRKPVDLAVLLTEVRAISRQDTVLFGGHLLKNAGNGSHEATVVSSGYKAFHFEFSAPVYGMQGNLEYSYQLVGYDPGWSSWSARPEKDYTNLSDGDYVFKVKARDNLGNESPAVTYEIRILPPWYKTIWAMAVYVLFALAVGYLFVRWQQYKDRRRQLRFDEEQKRMQYIYELELEKSEKEIIKLQNEKLENEVLLKKKELANTSLHLAGNVSTLEKIKYELNKFTTDADHQENLRRITALLRSAEKNNEGWEQFEAHFDELNNGFLNYLREVCPALSRAELRICAYLRLNLSSKEIAQQLNITVRGVEIHRYRIRKKLGLDTSVSLAEYLVTLKPGVSGE
ncbi:triple tyrosine motif-containing protein [Ravibacter arvi]|uniref:Triple tyrosine motif-containing protein n=1 Tax=Ravibacter arvi TaxID=2051041 RepID=A0ABP8M4Y5_9BACT